MDGYSHDATDKYILRYDTTGLVTMHSDIAGFRQRMFWCFMFLPSTLKHKILLTTLINKIYVDKDLGSEFRSF